MTIRGDNVIHLKDVYVGEVWLCAGQMNMDWPLHLAADADEAISDAKDSAAPPLPGALRGHSGAAKPKSRGRGRRVRRRRPAISRPWPTTSAAICASDSACRSA